MKKNLLLYMLFCFFAAQTFGQRNQENTYYPSNYLNKFVGEWKWVSGADTVILIFKKVAVKIPAINNSYWEELIGCHKYVNNGILIESSINDSDSLQYYNYENDIGTISMLGMDYGDTTYVEGTITDSLKHKFNKIKLTYLFGNPIQIRMQLSLKGAKVSLPGKPYIPGITLPTDIILTKE